MGVRSTHTLVIGMAPDVTPYLRLVLALARSLVRRLPANVDVGDLEGAGRLAVFAALKKDPTVSEAYLKTRIRGEMIDELRRQDWLTRRARQRGDVLPVAYTEDLAAGRFDAPDPCSGRPIEETDARLELARIDWRARRVLTPNERRVVKAYYFEGVQFNEIAKALRVTDARISQIHSRALRKLRAVAESKYRGRAPGALNKKTRALEPQVVAMRNSGMSIRDIMAATGLSRETVTKLAPRVSHSEAMRRKHVQWKAKGRPVLPPWRRAA
jgi:RNA polymerase sigma factor (sigma-70 family)